MKFKIPFTTLNLEALKDRSKKFFKFFRNFDKKDGYLPSNLRYCNVSIKPSEYLGICFRKFLIHFSFILIFSLLLLFLANASNFILWSFLIAILFSGFLFFIQIGYPRIFASKKEKDIERNLISALQDMLVQVKSGVSLYDVISNISNSNYGSTSNELKKAVNEITGGIPQVQALENLISENSSEYFKRVLWQLSNGLRSGSNMDLVLEDSITNIQKEQSLQIQTYGNKLNPIVMFYMLIAVIIPSLGVTFLIIISSMVGIEGQTLKLVFVGIFVFIVLIQAMFLGIIKTKRPSLL